MVPYAQDPQELAVVMQGYKLGRDGTMYYEAGTPCCFESAAAGADYINNLMEGT
ncbi:hypothetical protein ACP70R_048984 [Stipagrostis hirtigluma subsp. patula]